ncbi:MAG: spondin domain-containing protein [Planctomycetota bacterium]
MKLPMTAATLLVAVAAPAMAVDLKVTITNNAPDGGLALTPAWVGFHDGSFDIWNGGLTATVGLERLAEDGNNAVLSADFNAGRSFIQGTGPSAISGVFENTQPLGERIDGTIGSPVGPPPIQAGESVSQVFTIDTSDDRNRYFSYAAMVLPTNDFFVANGSPFATDLSPLFDGQGSISFNIGLANDVSDAGTEAEEFDFAAPPTGALQALFPGVGFGPDAGQIADNQSSLDNITAILGEVLGDPFAEFTDADGLDLTALNFNNLALYPNGIATITITAVPEPTTAAFGLVGASVFAATRRRKCGPLTV